MPSHLTESRLREHFAAKGVVTDTKILYNQDGSSRRFGFVGFKSDEDAQAAKNYFDRTYIGTSRISVQVVQVRASSAVPKILAPGAYAPVIVSSGHQECATASTAQAS